MAQKEILVDLLVIPALGRQRQEDQKCEASLGLHSRPLSKKKCVYTQTDMHTAYTHTQRDGDTQGRDGDKKRKETRERRKEGGR
jgi:hypothetical protein